MKKIVFVLEHLYGGGAERVTNVLANELCTKSDYEVHILTYTKDGTKEYCSNPRVIRHNLNETIVGGKRLLRIAEKIHFLRATIREIHPDCVLSLAKPETSILLSFAMLGLKIPLILSERNDPARFRNSGLISLLRNFCYRRCNGVVFQTNGAKSFFSKYIQKKSVVICNPLTSGLPDRYDGVRDKRIVNFCRLSPQKNLDLLIDAFYEVLKEFPDYTLWIYGEGPERERLTQKIKSMGMEKQVHLPGYSTNIHNEIRKAAAFVSSSDYEGISNSMLEAVAIGVPAICTDCPPGGARETIQNGVNGILVPIGDKVALSEAIISVLSSRDFSKTLSCNGSLLREKINVKCIAGQWLEFIEKQIVS